MKIEKKIIKEMLSIEKREPQTFSEKKQKIFINEKQLEKLNKK